VAKRNVPPADTWLADFRESAGLPPPPRTLSNAALRLVDLIDEFLYSLQGGWEIPPGFPRDRFIPTVYGKRDLVAPIVQYLDDFGFTGDARRLHEATRRFYAHRDWKLMTPSPGDDKRWKEFHERYVNPLVHLAGCLRRDICDVRQLIIDAAGREAATSKRSPNQTTYEQKVERILNRDDEDVELPFGYVPNVLPKVVESAKDSEESSNAIEVPQGTSLREILTAGLSDSEMNTLAKLIELEQQYWKQPNSKSNPLWQKRYQANRYQKQRAAKGKRDLALIARQIFEAEKDRMHNLNVQRVGMVVQPKNFS
jgi:hypothetical protein